MIAAPSGLRWLSFDCFGTLVDWERGIIAVFSPLFLREERTLPQPALLSAYAAFEAALERPPFRPYRQVLRACMRALSEHFALPLAPGEEDALLRALPRFPLFPDSREALARLRSRYRLALLSNTDRDLLAPVLQSLGNPFDCVLTSEEIGAYKPDPRCFEALLRATEAAPEEILHCAQSRFHDIAPARVTGLRTVWIRRGRSGPGAVPPSEARADHVLESLSELARWLGGEG
ncbi:MAG: haloacid dehalogenase [Lysobacterales bacterium]|jgi:2-haloacid dehalogenase|nr:MAG: haloacid dehalogenase [Xanthomonadales bacterium]